jgi:hypothetical protein
MTRTSVPFFPTPPANYDRAYFNQLIQTLANHLNLVNSPNPVENQLASAQWMTASSGAGGGFAGGLRGFQNSNGIILPNGMLMSDVDQANASITGENLLTYNSAPISYGVTFESGSRIKVPCAGQYLITFTLQVTNRGNTAAEFEVWAKSNGSNINPSNTRFDIPARKTSTNWAHIVPAVTGIFTVNDPFTDYLEIAWWSDSLDVYIEQYPSNTSPTRPAIPSVILTANFVSAN